MAAGAESDRNFRRLLGGVAMDYREMSRLAGNPDAVRTMAKLILALGKDQLGERSRAFLEKLRAYDGSRPLSVRQQETLFSLRENVSRRSRVGGYPIARLVAEAARLSMDLMDDEAEDWLVRLAALGPGVTLTRGECMRLIALCRRLDLIGPDEWIDLDRAA